MAQLTSVQWRTLLDEANDAEKPYLQALLDSAIKREQEAEKERKETLLRRQVAILEIVPSLAEEQCGEQLQSILIGLVQVRNLEDHTTQIVEVFAKLQTLQDDLTDMTRKYHDLTKEVAELRQAQVANPLPLPPGSEVAIETTSAPLTVSSSLNVMAAPSGTATGADSAVAVTSNEAGNSATAAAPRSEPVGAGPSYAGPYVDRKAVQIPSKYDGKEDIKSWISSMRAYFDILGTQLEKQSVIMGMNVEPVVRGFLEVQATRAGIPKIQLTRWLKATPVASLEELLISQYLDPHAATRARIQLDKIKRSKWTGSMKSLQTYLSKMFATTGLELRNLAWMWSKARFPLTLLIAWAGTSLSQCEWTKWKESLFMIKDARRNELPVLLDEKHESPVTFLNAMQFCKKWRKHKEEEQLYVAFVRPTHVPSTFAAMTKRQHAMIHHANKKRRPSDIEVGSYVWVKMSEFSEEEGVSRKLLPLYYGPWEVLDVIGEDHFGPSYVVDVPAHLRTYPVFHASKLYLHVMLRHSIIEKI
ncbi:hypothetical protein CBR_g50696 [Chara braunii]|uniref:Tf2-1-like SH3-like domain-containing protein n=1 Tax=Chara braunii TaxID=69332 RepID=A0A388K5V9_CHABU|nr:hypothetical protein CBR_g50696 [Chara braunii]|eukprot:GBG65333.1 hypothetical protein CBR_g50696 [Chara braunii]